MGKILKEEMAFCNFSFEGFCVCSILFSEATYTLLAAAIHSCLLLRLLL